MRNYELAYIAEPDMDAQALTALEEKVQGWIESAGGKIEAVERVGKKRLAYPVKKRMEGYYFYIKAQLPGQANVQLERDLRINEQVLRFMITQRI